MKPNDRQLLILDILNQEGQVKVQQLVSQFGASAETIRRDLNVLSQSGRLRKTHGGAVLPLLIGEGPYQQRMRENVTAKRSIAKMASTLILPGETIFIDTGSTTLTFVEALMDIANLTIITNSLDIAKVAGTIKASQVYLIGGRYSADNHETIGPSAMAQISAFRANHVILTVAGVDATTGVTDYNMNEAHVAHAMIEQSANIIVLADATKFGQTAPFEVARLNQLDYLVCEGHLGASLKTALELAKVKVLMAVE